MRKGGCGGGPVGDGGRGWRFVGDSVRDLEGDLAEDSRILAEEKQNTTISWGGAGTGAGAAAAEAAAAAAAAAVTAASVGRDGTTAGPTAAPATTARTTAWRGLRGRVRRRVLRRRGTTAGPTVAQATMARATVRATTMRGADVDAAGGGGTTDEMGGAVRDTTNKSRGGDRGRRGANTQPSGGNTLPLLLRGLRL